MMDVHAMLDGRLCPAEDHTGVGGGGGRDGAAGVPETGPGGGGTGDSPQTDERDAEVAFGEGGPDEHDPELLRATLVHLAAERDEARAKYQRALADYSNFQRRSTENERFARVQGRADVIRAIIPALDNFDRALGLPASSEGEQRLHEGLRLVKQELMQALSQQGTALIEPRRGDEFLPGQHEAMMRVPTDEFEPNHVADVYQAGYRLGEMVLRPAKVSVTAAPEPGDSEAAGK